jgi:hypothetical protein
MPNERDLAAAAATRKLLRQFPLIFDAVLADIQSDDHPSCAYSAGLEIRKFRSPTNHWKFDSGFPGGVATRF